MTESLQKERTRGARPPVCKTVKSKTAAAVCAVAGAVVLPQLVHILGAAAGTGSALGEALLPMHLFVILAGFFAGPLVGGLTGAVSPLLSHLLTGMPAVAVLPFMVLELFGYGLTEGFLAKTRLPSLVRLLLAQIAGRALRAAAVLAAFYGFGGGLPVSTIWTSITAGIFGIALQWALVPLIVFWAERKAKHE